MKLQLLEDINYGREELITEKDFSFNGIRNNLASDILDTLSSACNIREEDEV